MFASPLAVCARPRSTGCLKTKCQVHRPFANVSCRTHPGAAIRCSVVGPPPLKPAKPQLFYAGVSLTSDGVSEEKSLWGFRNVEHVMKPPKISKSDEEFNQAGVEFVAGREGLSIAELNDLFEKVGFPRRDHAKLQLALDKTFRIVWVRSIKQSRYSRLGQLLGFARATSDTAFTATIWDVAVTPSWQRIGLGRALMERLTNELVEAGIPTITLYAEPNVVGLYEKLGYVKDPRGIKGMAFKTPQPAKKKDELRFPFL